jgi:protein TonB
MTANDHFKSQYHRYLRWAAALAMILTLLLFFVSPPYEANPYRSREQEFIWVLPPPPDVEIEPPREIAPPPSAVEPAPDLEVAEDPLIADSLIPFDNTVFVPRPEYDPAERTDFVPSSTNPVLLYQAAPHYPEIARLARIEGTVVVNVLVGTDGNVIAAVIQNGAHSVLNKAALIAARKCKFEPGLQRSRAVKTWVQIPYRFRLH